jgi:DNA-binding PadR family transcriptional regulator
VDYDFPSMADDRADIDALLPLPSAAFHILLALAGGECHGYGIIQDVAARTDGALRLSPGTLYRTIQRLLEQGLIEEPRRLSQPKGDPRRRYYRLTSFGAAVARAETTRLAELVRMAKGAWRVAPKTS